MESPVENSPVENSSVENKPKRIPLTSKQIDVVTFIEQFWHDFGNFPDDNVIEQNVGSAFNLYGLDGMQNPTFQKALRNRGIVFKSQSQTKNPISRLTTEQMSAILTVLDFNDKRSRRAKLASVGSNTQQWNGWMKDERFKAYYDKMASKIFHDSIDLVQEGVISAAERGSVEAARFYYEATGRSMSPEVQNLKVLLARLVESIQRHVKDPTTISRIKRDFDILLEGREPEPPVDNVKEIGGI